MFCFAVVHIYCNFYKLKLCTLNKSMSTIFPKACAHLVLRYDILVFSHYFKLSPYNYFCYGDLWVEIFVVANAIVLEYHKLHLYEIGEINCCRCFDCSTDWPFLHLILVWPIISWDKRMLKLGKLINAQVFKWKKKNHVSF